MVEFKSGSTPDNWTSGVLRRSYRVSLWKYFRREWDPFIRLICYDVGKDYRVRFWHDLWQGETTLKDRYPTLFLIARDRGATVADCV